MNLSVGECLAMLRDLDPSLDAMISRADMDAWISKIQSAPKVDERVRAIRCNPRVGTGSCSSIDECMSDEELVQALDEDKITSPAAAVSWALEMEGIFLEGATNARWGEDDDLELERLVEFESAAEREEAE